MYICNVLLRDITDTKCNSFVSFCNVLLRDIGGVFTNVYHILPHLVGAQSYQLSTVDAHTVAL